MTSKTGRVACTLFCTLMLAASPSFAAMLDYTDSALWTSHVTVLASLGFEGITPLGTYAPVDGNAYTSPDVTISAPTLRVANLGGEWYDWGSGAFLQSNAGQTMLLNLQPGVTAVSFDVFELGSADREVTITVDGTDFLLSTFAVPNRRFFGLTSDTGFTSITIHGAGDAWLSLDNVQTGTLLTDPPVEGGEAPEVATWLLCGTGLFGAGMLRRLRVHYSNPAR